MFIWNSRVCIQMWQHLGWWMTFDFWKNKKKKLCHVWWNSVKAFSIIWTECSNKIIINEMLASKFLKHSHFETMTHKSINYLKTYIKITARKNPQKNLSQTVVLSKEWIRMRQYRREKKCKMMNAWWAVSHSKHWNRRHIKMYIYVFSHI